MNNEQKAREYLFKEHISPLNNILHQCDLKTEIQYHKDIENAFIKGAEWKDEQLADYLQREWDKWSGACSSIVSAHCREVERMANDLGIKLKFNNPYRIN